MQNQETANLIYFEQKPLNEAQPSKQESISSQVSHFSTEQLLQRSRISEEFQVFQRIYDFISSCNEKDSQGVERLCKAISDYVIYLVKYQKDDLFFQHAVQKKIIALLLKKIQDYKFMSDIVKIVFSSLEYLLRAITKDEQYVYLVMSINKQGFLTAKYQFEEDDAPYFVNFLKLLVRKINEDEKYLSIFFNFKQPEFPLLLNLLRFHDQKDQILRTSVELTLIQMCSNQSKLVQKYISNFPFVMFYPIYAYRIYNSFIDSLSDNESTRQVARQTLKTSLKFMEDFIQNKDRQAIEMYANCFMVLVGRYFYRELAEFGPKNQEKVVRMLRAFYEIVVKDVTVLKIKMGLEQFFSKKMGKYLHKFLKLKTHHMQFTYWIAESCKDDIHSHCQVIYPQQQKKKSPRSSFIKTFNSYIPHTKDNWLYHEVKKVSEMIGFEIELNKEINAESYQAGSYLEAIELDTKGEEVENEVYEKLVRSESEEVMFYYLKLVSELKVPLKRQGVVVNHVHTQGQQAITELLTLMNRATSLSVVKSFYQLVLHNQIYINQIKNYKIKQLYQNVLQRLIYFILTEGWNSFWNRSKICIKCEDNSEFSPDIFRDLECDILFFVGLRHILGTKNNDGIKDDQQFANRDARRVQTRANCLWLRQNQDNTLTEQQIQIILDGQYIKLLSQEQKSITHDNILINRCFVHETEQSNTFEIVQKENNQFPQQLYYLVEFLQTPIKNYISKEIKFRKEMVMDLELKLRLVKFELGE